jgi:potassium voltage-gated channel KQT-like subfamily protein 1
MELGVAITMEQEASTTPTTLLPVPGLFKNPLKRLASRTSMKMLFTSDSAEKKDGKVGCVGVTAPYYPIFLPIDQDFKAKYLWHHRMAKRGRSIKERIYSFLEHPVGWLCFTYHIFV